MATFKITMTATAVGEKLLDGALPRELREAIANCVDTTWDGEDIIRTFDWDYEKVVELPTTPGSIISSDSVIKHPGWVLTQKSEWVSLRGNGMTLPVEDARAGLASGRRHIVFDAGKASQ